MGEIIDILLRLKAEGIPRHRTAWSGVSGLQTPKPVRGWNRCVAGQWAVSWKCQAPGTPILNRGEVPVLSLPQGLRLVSTNSGLLASLTIARCLLFDSHVGHTLFPAWADTRTAIFRALGYIRVITDAPTWHTRQYPRKTFGIPRCDGAYPRRERCGIAPVPHITRSYPCSLLEEIGPTNPKSREYTL